MKELLTQLDGRSGSKNGNNDQHKSLEDVMEVASKEKPESEQAWPENATQTGSSASSKKRPRDMDLTPNDSESRGIYKMETSNQRGRDTDLPEQPTKRLKLNQTGLDTYTLQQSPMLPPASRLPSSAGPRTPQRTRLVQPSSPAKRRLFDVPTDAEQVLELVPLVPLKPMSSTLTAPGPLRSSGGLIHSRPSPQKTHAGQTPKAETSMTDYVLSPSKESSETRARLGSEFWLPLPPQYLELEETFKYPLLLFSNFVLPNIPFGLNFCVQLSKS